MYDVYMEAVCIWCVYVHVGVREACVVRGGVCGVYKSDVCT